MKVNSFSLKFRIAVNVCLLSILFVSFLFIFRDTLLNISISIIISTIAALIISNFVFNYLETQLEKKDREIMAQRDEINALYQQTTAMNEELYSLLNEIKDNYLFTVRALANSIEASDKYTKGHCERVTKYALGIAEAMGFSVDDMLDLEFAAILHDIGKIGIPSNVLNKNNELSKEEYELIRTHPQIGYDILKDIDFLKKSTRILVQHHERVDGKGYPLGITGDSMSKLSKILAVADSYDAMTSSRPYRQIPLTMEEAINQLKLNKNTQFDGDTVDAFVGLLDCGKLS